MKKKRRRRILINKQENRLLSNSVILERYPRLKVILDKYSTLYENNMKGNDDFDDEIKNLILYVFKDIVNEAVEEWRGNGEMDIAENKKVYCSLCKKDNKYIFYIKNIHSDMVLNVGSDCIDKFPKLKIGLPEGMTATQYKNKKIREYEKLKRLEEFNLRFPDAENMLNEWKKEYNNLPIILPTGLHENIIEIHQEAEKVFKGFIDGKVKKDSLILFETLINKRNKSISESRKFIDKNKGNKYICTREIYDFILEYSDYKTKLVKQIRDNQSMINKDTISFIYENEFMLTNLVEFNKMLEETNVSIKELGANNVYLKFKDKKGRKSYDLFLPKKDFMKMYGMKLFESNSSINEKEIILKSEFANNEDNFKKIQGKLEEILKGSNYDIELDYNNFSRGLEFINKTQKEFKDQLSPAIFFNAQKEKILFENEESKQEICEIIKSIQKWRPLSDKKKYDVGDISKVPTGN